MSTADDAFKERPIADPAAGAMELTDSDLEHISAGAGPGQEPVSPSRYGG